MIKRACSSVPRLASDEIVKATSAATSYLLGLGLNEKEANQVLEKFPNLALVSIDQPLSAKIEFMSEKGMANDRLVSLFDRALRIFPEFVELDLDLDIKPVFEYFERSGIENDKILEMITIYPPVVGYEVSDVKKKVDFLREIFLGDEEMVLDATSRFPQLFGVSLEENMQPIVTYLTQELDFSPPELKKIFRKSPHLLGVSLEAIRAKLDFLIQSGFEFSSIKALTKRFPHFLRTSLSDNLRPTIEILLQYSPRRDIQNLFYVCPQTLVLPYGEEILPKFRFFIELGYDPVDLRILIEEFPEILCYSLDNEIMPAVEWSLNIGLSFIETRIAFARFPDMLRQTIARVKRLKSKT